MASVILTFHGIGPIPQHLDEKEQCYWLEMKQFEGILNIVRKQPHVALTFDDGNISDVEYALPNLIQRGLTATFLVCTDRLDRPAYLSREQVRQLQEQGMRIGSHGISHRPWRGLPGDELTAELNGSRIELENICGEPVLEAACPFGEYDRTVLRALHTAGYRQVYTSDGGWTSDLVYLKARNTIRRSMSLEEVALLTQRKPRLLDQVKFRARQVFKRLR
jgi:peptidoglycan/xylan/chitin deacetylase (PgdA/CDA1 family)